MLSEETAFTDDTYPFAFDVVYIIIPYPTYGRKWLSFTQIFTLQVTLGGSIHYYPLEKKDESTMFANRKITQPSLSRVNWTFYHWTNLNAQLGV